VSGAPRDGGPESRTFPAEDGTPLAARVWRKEGSRGVLVVAHGVGEHAGCYDTLGGTFLRPAGADVVAFDFRGHGRSPGRRGVVRHYDDLLGDLRAALRWAAREWEGRPVFLLGHSNGGQVAARVAAAPPVPLSGLILSNPALGLRVDVPRWKLRLGRILQRVAPGVTLPTGLDDAQMTAHPVEIAIRRADPLRHDRISPPLFFGMLEGAPRALADAGRLELPILLILGGSDPVTDPAAARAFLDRVASADRMVKTYEEMRHEPFHEVGCGDPLRAVATWVRDRLPGTPGPGEIDRIP
jgi:alpha-beta hydrolase superfamily lysophospholipase